ncbi:MAG: hypothetical protein RMK29_09035 [Myxococcales bacterium]|nr:hypothetical protein [Myxococcota bacterium]MDW8281842.1 hypothetical protein [Myxococcales bacterium]
MLAARAWLLMLLTACVQGPAPPSRKPPLYTDEFNRTELGPDWLATAPAYRVVGGELIARGARNHPLWLRRELPDDAVIELEARSMDPAGDIKVEAWGDGRSHATAVSYTSTGYVFIQGGWHNRITALCRLDEHGADRRTRTDLPVQQGRRYRWVIVRRGGRIEWFIDGRLALDMDDPAPLRGPGHRHFAFNDWETEVHFDNLIIRPL